MSSGLARRTGTASCMTSPETSLMARTAPPRSEQMPPDPELEQARQLAGVSIEQLWYDYIALGGTSTPAGLQHGLADANTLSDHEHDVIAHAINERFMD